MRPIWLLQWPNSDMYWSALLTLSRLLHSLPVPVHSALHLLLLLLLRLANANFALRGHYHDGCNIFSRTIPCTIYVCYLLMIVCQLYTEYHFLEAIVRSVSTFCCELVLETWAKGSWYHWQRVLHPCPQLGTVGWVQPCQATGWI